MDDLEVDTQTEDDLSDVEMAEDDESQMDESGYSDFEEYSSSDDSTDSEEETARNILRYGLIFWNSLSERLQFGALGTRQSQQKSINKNNDRK